MKTLFTTRELREYLDVSRPTIYGWIKNHGLPCIRLGRNVVRYDKAAVDEWMAQQTLQVNAEATAQKDEHSRLGRFHRMRPVAFALD